MSLIRTRSDPLGALAHTHAPLSACSPTRLHARVRVRLEHAQSTDEARVRGVRHARRLEGDAVERVEHAVRRMPARRAPYRRELVHRPSWQGDGAHALVAAPGLPGAHGTVRAA